MNNIFIVIRGGYSDKYNDAVFDSREKAEEYLSIIGSDGYIEEHELNHINFERRDVYNYGVMFYNGSASEPKLFGGDVVNCISRKRCEYMSNYIYEICVQAKNAELAKKIASDLYLIAKDNNFLKYPHINKKCVDSGYGFMTYPTYDLESGEIMLTKEQKLVEKWLR